MAPELYKQVFHIGVLVSDLRLYGARPNITDQGSNLLSALEMIKRQEIRVYLFLYPKCVVSEETEIECCRFLEKGDVMCDLRYICW